MAWHGARTMLGTRERTLLFEHLRPPTGYHLRRAVGTSYTLDLIALLTAPLAFTFFDAHDEDGGPVADPVALLEALRRHAEKVTLFCQAGAIAVPKPEQTLLAYLEGSVINVQPQQEGGIFHPKVWVLDFEADGRPPVYRVLCLSRNLTFARAWDTCLCLDGRLTQRNRGYGRNKPFADLLLALPRLATRPISAELREDLTRMAYEVRRVDFQPPQPFTGFRVHHFGLWRKRGWAFPSGGRSLVVSPYLGGSKVRDLIRNHGLDVLISRPEAFEEVVRNAGSRALPQSCYVLSTGANLDTLEAEEGGAEESKGCAFPIETSWNLPDSTPSCFFSRTGGRHASSPARPTRRSLHSNKTWNCWSSLSEGPRIVASSRCLAPPRIPCSRLSDPSFRSTGLPDPLEPPDDTKRTLERRADCLARKFGAACLIAKVCDADDGQRWDMTLCGEIPEVPAGAEVRVWPATLSPEAALRIDCPTGEASELGRPADPVAAFRGLSFDALTAFFAFEVYLREGSHHVRQRFAVTADLVGAPENRKERLLRSLLKDRGRVLRLLFLILMDEGADVSAFIRAARRDESASAGQFGGLEQAALLEALLRSLSRNPERIDQAARLIADLRSTPEGEDLLPNDLNKIWEPVWTAREALKS